MAHRRSKAMRDRHFSNEAIRSLEESKHMRLASVGENDVIAHLLSRKGDKYIRSLSSYLKKYIDGACSHVKEPKEAELS